MTEREKCAEILARLKIPAWNSYIDAMIEARDLARREALNEAANFIEDDPNPYRWIMGAKIRSLIPSNEVAPAAKLLSQPSPETVQCDAHLCVTGNYEKGDRRDCKYENPPPKSASASVPAEPDLASILGDLTNLIQNERVKSYNEGFDAARAKLVEK